jgi:hypothetical protein
MQRMESHLLANPIASYECSNALSLDRFLGTSRSAVKRFKLEQRAIYGKEVSSELKVNIESPQIERNAQGLAKCEGRNEWIQIYL